MKNDSLYMHTLDGKPAYFYESSDGDHIIYAGDEMPRLAASLAQIKSEQQRTRDTYNRIDMQCDSKFGYIRINRKAFEGDAW